MAGDTTPPATPTAADIAAAQAAAEAGNAAVQQGLTRAEVEDAIEKALEKHRTPRLSDDDISTMAEALANEFEKRGAFEHLPQSGGEVPVNPTLTAPSPSSPVPSEPATAPPAAPSNNPASDVPPVKRTFADNFLKER